MQNTASKLDLENSKLANGSKVSLGKLPRRKYAKKGGRTLLNKSAANNFTALSIETSTKSSEGFSSMGVLASKSSSVSVSPFSLFLFIFQDPNRRDF